MANRKYNLTIKTVLVILSILVSIKLIFVGYCHDEEYQIVMAYRHAMGDTLFGTMWEPHQTSSFINAALIALFLTITGSTSGIILYLRIIGCLVQFALSFFFCKTLRSFKPFDKEPLFAFILSAIYYSTTVSLFAFLEYSNMLYYSTTLFLIFLGHAFLQDSTGKLKQIRIILAAVSLCLMILSFPPMIIFAPVSLVFIIVISSHGEKIKNALSFSCAGLGFGLIYSLRVIASVGLSTFLSTIPRIIISDNTHQVSSNSYWSGKIPSAVSSISLFFVLSLAALLLSYITYLFILRKKICGMEKAILASGIISLFITFLIWTVFKRGFEDGQVFILTGLVLLAIITTKTKEIRLKHFLCFSLITAIANLFIGYSFSNMEFSVKLPHIIYVIVLLLVVVSARMLLCGEKMMLLLSLLLFFAFFAFAKGFMLRSGNSQNNILSTENICRSGPGLGIMSDYMRTHIMDRTYAEWDEYVNEDDRVLIVTKTLHSDLITAYMNKPVTISHYAVNNPYTYSDTLADYWALYPSKKPNVIIIDCWFGDPLIDDSEWIMQYINNEFNYTLVNDGEYLRYYRCE